MRVSPHRTLGVIGAAVVLGSLLHGGSATAAPQLRAQVEQKGDFVLIGNTLGHECNGGVAPIVGTVGACGNNLGDSAPDVYWRADAPADGQAQANNMVTAAEARSTALLAIPPGATITHAYLYWAARNPASDLQVTLDGPNASTLTVPGAVSATNGNEYYQSVADVTSFVQSGGPGAYRVSNVASSNLINLNENTSFAGWWMTVLYELPTDPPRNLAIFDGLDLVQGNNTINVPISGFLVPMVGFDAKLGVVTFEGDSSITGDSLAFNGVQLSNAVNPANNFFNGTRSFFGAPRHGARRSAAAHRRPRQHVGHGHGRGRHLGRAERRRHVGYDHRVEHG
jgi:clumping factor A